MGDISSLLSDELERKAYKHIKRKMADVQDAINWLTKRKGKGTSVI